MSQDKPTIDVPENGPFLVKGLKKLTAADGQPVAMAKDVVALCRCGASSNKPFCDGTHKEIGFTGARERDTSYPVKEAEAGDVTVVDDVGICSHAGACVEGAPQAFFDHDGDERIARPDEADREQLLATIRKCPSGSLLYKLKNELQAEFFAGAEAEIYLSKDGPLEVRGGITIDHEQQPPTTDHYTLCRCGASKNKPYCDGAHKDVGFTG